MEFCYIKGFCDKVHQLVYIRAEKHLFSRTHEKNGIAYYCCYHKIMVGDNKQAACAARCKINLKTSVCNRNGTVHTDHTNHEVVFRDLESINSMKNHCRYLAEHFPFSAHRIPIKDIFLGEMAK